MPMFGFICPDCGESFEELVFSTSRISQVRCPQCGSDQVERQLSRVAAPVISGASRAGYSAACAPGGT